MYLKGGDRYGSIVKRDLKLKTTVIPDLLQWTALREKCFLPLPKANTSSTSLLNSYNLKTRKPKLLNLGLVLLIIALSFAISWLELIMFILPYAPEENPIENVWGQLKLLRSLYFWCRSFS